MKPSREKSVDKATQHDSSCDEGFDAPNALASGNDDDGDSSNDSDDFRRDKEDGFFTLHSVEEEDFDPLCLRCNIPSHYVPPGTYREIRADTRLRAVWKRRRTLHLAECLGNERQSQRTFEEEEDDCLQTVGVSSSLVGQATYMTPEVESELRTLIEGKYEGLDSYRLGEANRRVLAMMTIAGDLRSKLKEKRLTPFEVCQFQEVRGRLLECCGERETRQELLDLAALFHWTCQTDFDKLSPLPLA
jgi:hypothetical protein